MKQSIRNPFKFCQMLKNMQIRGNSCVALATRLNWIDRVTEWEIYSPKVSSTTIAARHKVADFVLKLFLNNNVVYGFFCLLDLIISQVINLL